jgi:hypothetical protein
MDDKSTINFSFLLALKEKQGSILCKNTYFQVDIFPDPKHHPPLLKFGLLIFSILIRG